MQCCKMLIPVLGLLAKQSFPIEYWQHNVISFMNFHFYEFSLRFGLENGMLGNSKGASNGGLLESIRGRNDANSNASICGTVLLKNTNILWSL